MFRVSATAPLYAEAVWLTALILVYECSHTPETYGGHMNVQSNRNDVAVALEIVLEEIEAVANGVIEEGVGPQGRGAGPGTGNNRAGPRVSRATAPASRTSRGSGRL